MLWLFSFPQETLVSHAMVYISPIPIAADVYSRLDCNLSICMKKKKKSLFTKRWLYCEKLLGSVAFHNIHAEAEWNTYVRICLKLERSFLGFRCLNQMTFSNQPHKTMAWIRYLLLYSSVHSPAAWILSHPSRLSQVPLPPRSFPWILFPL